MRKYRYFEWTTAPAGQLSGDQLMDALSDYLTEDGDIARAMQMLMQRGMSSGEQKMQGLRDMLEQLRKRKQQQLDRYDLNSLLNDLREKLDRLLQQERQAIADLGNKAQTASTEAGLQPSPAQQATIAEERREFLDALPNSLAEQLQALRPYDFLDPQAAQAFQDLLEELQRHALRSQLNRSQAPSDGSTAEEARDPHDMYRDLNQQLREKLQGRQPDVPQLTDQHTPFRSGRDEPLDGLIRQLQQQLQQWHSLLESLAEPVRRELEQLMDASLDADLQAQQAELRELLDRLAEKKLTPQRYRFKGREQVSLEQAQELMEHLQQLEALEKQLEGVRWNGDPQQMDAEKLQQQLGDEAFQSVQNMKDIAKSLEAAGYLVKTKDGLQLTPLAMRKIGQKALRDIFFFIKRDRLGEHDTRERGGVGLPTEETKTYEFGDPLLLDLGATVFNAVSREGTGTPVSLHVEDFVIRRQEFLSHTSTVILIDMSGSMAWNNCFYAAKKVALALDNLVRSTFPRDTLQIVGFYTAAEEMKPADLPYVKPKSFGYNASLYSDYYDMLMGYIDVQLDYRDVVRGRTNVPQGFTNMQQGLRLAEQMLTKRQSPNKQIILITDGQPTAHCEGDRLYLQYPPSQRTITATLQEVKRCTSKGIAINTFMLAKSYYLERFVDQMTKINRGRAFYTTPEQLGEYLVVDYLAKKRRRIA
ncbi:MAG TPA: VWA domain-containing protein [Candidatus Tectomicrobia bacterium]|nr:VWA domain-containing protein [Candidatus Tectomicrobia bacterium]